LQGRDTRVVDKDDTFPVDLAGRRVTVIAVARQGALERHVEKLWPGAIVINETYPQPSKGLLQRLRAKGVVTYHLVGVKAPSLPRFPEAYAGGVPCCGMRGGVKFEPLVRKLS
jgi:hypothetical protein